LIHFVTHIPFLVIDKLNCIRYPEV
jgi:hypothetical protein